MTTEPAFDFLGLTGKTILVMGVANKKSVAYRIANILEKSGAEVIYSVRSQARKESLAKLLRDRKVLVCDVEQQDEIDALAAQLRSDNVTLAGLVHSVAFADYPDGIRPFHETTRAQFLQAVDISAFSLTTVSNAVKELLARDASVVTIGISTTRMASESYGFMAPIKAALESSLAFLTKSFSRFSEVRFNAVSAGLLKTSASAGIPVTSIPIYMPKRSSLAVAPLRPMKWLRRPHSCSAREVVASRHNRSSWMPECR